MPYTLSQAAEAVGMNRSSILRAIKAGKISATRDEHDQWQIEPAELHRVYPAPTPATSHTDELIAELRARLDDMRAALAKAEVNAETWRQAFEREQAQRALPTPSANAQQGAQQPAEPTEPPSRLRRAWRWMRATGCLAGASLLLVLATVAASAQQQQQQTPQRECFAVAMNTQASLGSILVDKCTGKTWVLGRFNLRGGGYALRWFPITVESTELGLVER